MDRRDILKATAGLALAGCGTTRGIAASAPSGSWSDAEVARTLADLDSTIEKLSEVPPQPELYLEAVVGRSSRPTLPPLDQVDVERAHNLVQRTFAALHISATFHDLPKDVQARSDTQRRMWRAVPLLDSAVVDLADYLGSMSAADRRKIQAEIDRDPNLVMDVAGALDDQAARVGVPTRRRAQLRSTAAHVSWRMAHQSVGALLDDVLGKVERVRERHARDEELRRAIAAKVLEAELFGPPGDASTRLMSGEANAAPPPMPPSDALYLISGEILQGTIVAESPSGWTIVLVDGSTRFVEANQVAELQRRGAGGEPAAQPRIDHGHGDTGGTVSPTEHARRVRRADIFLGVGGGLLLTGGFVAGGGAAVMSSGNIAGAFVVTAGAVLGVTGLVLLIIGIVMAANAANDVVAGSPSE
jgi:hypothetical protein